MNNKEQVKQEQIKRENAIFLSKYGLDTKEVSKMETKEVIIVMFPGNHKIRAKVIKKDGVMAILEVMIRGRWVQSRYQWFRYKDYIKAKENKRDINGFDGDGDYVIL